MASRRWAAAPATAGHPVFVLSGDPRADHARLRAMAERSGGAYFNLQRTTDADVLPTARTARCSRCWRVDVDRNAVADLEPSGAQAVTGGRVRIAGRLLVPEARMTLRYGVPGQPPLETRTIALQRQPGQPKATGLVEQLWAQQRLATLGVDPEANHDELVRLGQRFSIVTPGTSLLVLETLEQYLQHDVTPPVDARRNCGRRSSSDARPGDASRRTRVSETRRRASSRCGSVAWRGGRANSTMPADFRFDEPKPPIATDLPSGATQAQRRMPRVPPIGARAAAARWPRRAPARARVAAASVTVTVARRRQSSTPPGALHRRREPRRRRATHRRSSRGIPTRRICDRCVRAGAMPTAAIWPSGIPTARVRRSISIAPTSCSSTASAISGLRVLTNVAELKLEDARLLRVLAHRLAQVDELDLAIELFDRVRRLRPEEPQSCRDLALALDRRAGARSRLAARLAPPSIDDYTRALALFGEIVDREWDARFPEIEVIALIEANRIQSILERNGRRVRGRSTRGCGACSTSTSASC